MRRYPRLLDCELKWCRIEPRNDRTMDARLVVLKCNQYDVYNSLLTQ